MSRRRQSQVRSRRRPRQLAVEGLEGRRLLSANVAVGTDAGALSQPLVRLVDAESGVEQASVLAYEAAFKGGVRVAMGNVTGNEAPDVVVGCGSGRVAEVRVFKPVALGGTTTLTQVLAFKPFGDTYKGGIEVGVGDVDGDKTPDIVVSKSREGGDAKVFKMTNPGGTLTQTLYATIAKPFGGKFNGGSSVAVADVGTFSNGALTSATSVDGKGEVVIGSGAGIAAKILVYDVSNPAAPRVADTIKPQLLPTYVGGVSVSAGLVNNDFIEDIVASTGRGAASKAFVYDGTVGAGDNPVLKSFSTYASLARPNAAVFTSAVDVNGDGLTDRFLQSQGDPGGTAGLSNVSTAGVRSGAVTGFAGPLRVEAPRFAFSTQNTSTATKVVSGSVPVGTTRSMQYRDVVTGTGTAATAGKTLEVQYTGTLVDGTMFDTSRQTGRTSFKFTLGAGQVISGWDTGLVGMKVGGRRQLVIPAELAYGDAGSGTLIKKGDTLYFDVELVSVT